MLNLTLAIDGANFSANRLYKKGKYGNTYLDRDVQNARDRLAPVIQDAYDRATQKWRGGPIKATVVYQNNWFTQAGEPRVFDLDNQLKNSIDTVFKPLGINDKFVFWLQSFKAGREADVPRTLLWLKEVTYGEVEREWRRALAGGSFEMIP